MTGQGTNLRRGRVYLVAMYRYLMAASVLAAPLGAQTTASIAPPTGPVWQIVPQPQSSLVFARDGAFIGEIGREARTSVSIRTLPKYVGQAFVAVEDQRFYEHDGVDLIGVAGAIKGKLLEGITGKHRGGASTITQLLVGNMHPDQIDRRDLSLARKLHEQQAAREMERHYTKEQILEAFLNQINFGHGWYGVGSAARHYFGKDATRLTLAEAATLAALPKSPVGYDPSRYPDKARSRRDLILSLMAAQGFISHTNGPNVDLGCGLGHQAGETVGDWSLGVNDSQLNSMFMASPDHRANILGPYNFIATAWVVGANGYGYIAVEFS